MATAEAEMSALVRSSRSSINRSAVVKMQNADRVHLRIATRTCDLEGKGRRGGRRAKGGVNLPTRIDRGSANDRFN